MLVLALMHSFEPQYAEGLRNVFRNGVEGRVAMHLAPGNLALGKGSSGCTMIRGCQKAEPWYGLAEGIEVILRRQQWRTDLHQRLVLQADCIDLLALNSSHKVLVRCTVKEVRGREP